MRFPIGYRLFLAIVLSFVVLAVLGMALVRWRLFDGTSQPDEGALGSDVRWQQVLASALEARFDERVGWRFLPPDREARARWLRDLLDAQRSSHPELPAPSRTLAYRLGLLDAQREVVAGAVAAPAIVAFASIDRRSLLLARDNREIGVLVLARPQGLDDELAVAFLIDQQSRLAWLLLAGFVLSAAVAAVLAARFRAPIAQLALAARRLEHGQFDARVHLRRRDELGRLAAAFNTLAAKLEDVERSRRLWVANTSHELRTPLAVMRAQLEALQDGIRAPTRDSVDRLLQQVAALSALVDDLHQLARADLGTAKLERVPTDIVVLASEVAQAFAPRLQAAGLCLAVDNDATPAQVACDPVAMRRVFNNLFENCLRYTDTGGSVRLQATTQGSRVQLTIEDSAPGVPAPLLVHLGERFFRVDVSRTRATGGSGLGLALCRQLLEAQRAALSFAASPLGGLRVVIAFDMMQA